MDEAEALLQEALSLRCSLSTGGTGDGNGGGTEGGGADTAATAAWVKHLMAGTVDEVAFAPPLHGPLHFSDQVASTLHEMGVLYIRRSEWNRAKAFLECSLGLKRRLQGASTQTMGESSAAVGAHASNTMNMAAGKGAWSASSSSPSKPFPTTSTAASTRFSEEAATLHQLAVVAMSAKPTA